ncbi:MAG: hypothetical protein Q7J27_07900 [Syntrophales bacterium]|nr:hypothetical protein [Syntrophales bacterium]
MKEWDYLVSKTVAPKKEEPTVDLTKYEKGPETQITIEGKEEPIFVDKEPTEKAETYQHRCLLISWGGNMQLISKTFEEEGKPEAAKKEAINCM